MKRGVRAISTAAFFCFLLADLSSLFAEGVPVYTEQDLEIYGTNRGSGSGASVSHPQAGQSFRPGSVSRPVPLRRFEVPYTACESGARRIIVGVTLNNTVTATMALDTGSPGMIISDSLASCLGIFRGDEGRLMVTASGIGGKTPAVLTIIDSARIGGAEDRFIPTLITPRLSDSFEGLIGMDFLANYSIQVDAGRRIVIFTEQPASPSMPGGHDESWWRSHFSAFARMRSEWQAYREKLTRTNADPETLRQLKSFAESQYREADKLFSKLNGYAIQHLVPMHWREY
ncbi:MAG: hypothetical protein OHK006_07460 [Thermodesulfovibrionales bacterium]